MYVNKKYRSKWLVLTLMSISLVLGMNVGIQASQINNAPFVDKISVSQTEANIGESVEIDIAFSEKQGHKFKPGDQMVFDLPKELDGFVDNLKLEDYATVRVEHGRAIVTFTDKVAVKENIRGTLSFNAQVKKGLADNSEKNIRLDFGTNIRNVPTLKVKGYKTNQPQQQPKASYKGGWVDVDDPTIMHWYVVVNAGQQKINGDVVVTDELGPGHIYVRDSFKFTGNDSAQTPRVNIRGKVVNGDTFTVTLPESYVSGRGIQIDYQTRLTRAGKKMKRVNNSFFTKFQSGYNNPKSIGGGWQLANLLIKGNIEGDDSLNHADQEETEPLDLETLNPDDDIAPIVPEQGHEEETDKLEDGIHGTKPEIHINPIEEVIPDEDTDEIAPIVPDHGNESVEENKLEDGIHGSNPEVHGNQIEEVIPDEDTDEITPIVPDHGHEVLEEDKLEDGIHGSKPDVHVDTNDVNQPKPMPAPKSKGTKTEESFEPKSLPVQEPHVKPEHIVELPKSMPAPKAYLKTKKQAQKYDGKTEETKDVQKVQPVVSKTPKAAVETHRQVELPNTGSDENAWLTILGVISLLASGLTFNRRKS